jgi:hypothetical protein
MVDDAPNWTLCLEIVGIVVTMAFVPLLPLAVWKIQQWKQAQRSRTGTPSDQDSTRGLDG